MFRFHTAIENIVGKKKRKQGKKRPQKKYEVANTEKKQTTKRKLLENK